MKEGFFVATEETGGLFAPLCECIKDESGYVFQIKNTKRALKKLKKQLRGERVIVKKDCESKKIFENSIFPYESYSYEVLLPVMEKICRQTGALYGISIPFREVYIAASPPIACEIIEKIHFLSKIFSVISEEEVSGKIYDGLYFKHGTIVRTLPEFINMPEDSLLIKCNALEMPENMSVPVIDMSPRQAEMKKCVKTEQIYICDSNISPLQKIWGGDSGIMFYSLFGALPSESADVDIMRKADKIFLLDTESI